MGGYNSLPVQSGRNPYLDEIDAAANNAHAQLSPGAQMALRKAGAPVEMTGGAPATPQITNPRPAPPAIGQPPMSENLPNGQPAMLAGTGIHMPTRQQPQAVPPTAAEGPIRGELQRLTAPPPTDPNLVHTKQNTGTAGVNQIHNPWARIPLQIASAVGETFAPRLAAALPGTESHHQLLVGETEGALKQQQGIRKAEEEAGTAASEQGLRGAQAANLEGEQPLHEAQTNEANARAWSLLNPADKEKQTGTVHEDAQGNYWVIHGDGTATQVAPQGQPLKGKPSTETGGTVHEDSQGNMWVVKGDGTAIPVTPKQSTQLPAPTLGASPSAPTPAGSPVVTPGTPNQLKGKPPSAGDDFSQFYQKWLKEKNLPDSATNEKKARTEWSSANRSPEGESGTWALQEGPDGKPLLFNSKTGQTKPAPEGLVPRGTAAKDQPTKDALVYAENYMKRGQFTGPGDLALMDQFYQAAKPKRMNEKQNQLLLESQSMVESAKQSIARKFTPNAPYFDDTQRANIVQTMRDLAQSQAHGVATEGGAPAGGGTVPNVGETFQGGKVLKVTKIK